MALDNLLNEAWYLHNNLDVAAALGAGNLDARTHFEKYGRLEGRAPGPYFDAGFYLHASPDINAAVEAGFIRVVDHFLAYGYAEDRPISPFFDLGAYVRANPDLVIASEQQGFNALEHLLTYGFAEDRSLGNGISLRQFENDPTFTMAIANGGDPFAALARVAEIAPFLPTFEAPPGWQAPEDTPIPQDFVPVPGEWLVLPDSISSPGGTRLPDAFRLNEPTTPIRPTWPSDPVPPQEPDEEDGSTSPKLHDEPTPELAGTRARTRTWAGART